MRGEAGVLGESASRLCYNCATRLSRWIATYQCAFRDDGLVSAYVGWPRRPMLLFYPCCFSSYYTASFGGLRGVSRTKDECGTGYSSRADPCRSYPGSHIGQAIQWEVVDVKDAAAQAHAAQAGCSEGGRARRRASYWAMWVARSSRTGNLVQAIAGAQWVGFAI
jgi:hypothetical protein